MVRASRPERNGAACNRDSVAFYIQVINQHPEFVDLSQAEMRQTKSVHTG